jgi:putative oxidoreductase
MLNVRLIMQLAIGTLFLLSTAGKLRDPGGFVRGVRQYQILPAIAVQIGLIIIPLEGFLAISHLSGWMLSLSALIGCGLLSIFAVAVTVNLYWGRAVPCYCFGGGGDDTISLRTLARLVLLLTGEMVLLFGGVPLTKSRLVFPRQVGTLSEFGKAAFWTGLLLVAASWLLSAGDLWDLLCAQEVRAREGMTGPVSPGAM